MASVFDLEAILRLNSSDYDKGLANAGNNAQSFGQKLASGLGTFAKVGLAAATAAIGAAAAGIASITKQAVENYAEYEQLVGGVETLFGDSAAKVVQDASNAFKDAGMSMNDYMETSIQSAAALINSLGGDQAKAADLMNMSIIDMSDNVNKMGTSMEAVQNAYRGFSRGNFTMLDNLALGFAGTKEGMQQLLEAAQQISGVEYDISSYSDIVQAIHVVQEEMGIAGTTAKEANETISGSFSSMKAAWQNLVTAFADKNANLGPLIDNLVQSAETAFGNLLPVIEQALVGIARAVETIAPIIADKLPGIINSILPPLLNAATTLVNSLVEALPAILQTLIDVAPTIIGQIVDTVLSMLPQIIQLGAELLVSLTNGIAESLPTLIPTVVDVVLQIAETLIDNLDMMVDASIELILALADGIIEALPKLLEKAPVIIEKLVTALANNLPKIVKAGIELLVKLVEGIISAIPKLLEAIPKIITSLVNGFKQYYKNLLQVGKEFVEEVKSGFSQKVQDAVNWGKDLIQNFINGIKAKWNALKESVANVANTVKSFLGFSEPEVGPLSDFHTYAPDMINLFIEGLRKNEWRLKDALDDILQIDDAKLELRGTSISTDTPTADSKESDNKRFGDIIININGANYSNENELARAIGRELQMMSDRRAAIFA